MTVVVTGSGPFSLSLTGATVVCALSSLRCETRTASTALPVVQRG